jgi:transcriptional regulator with XRE-family HTH domain
MSLPDTDPDAPKAASWEQVVNAIGPKVRQMRQQLGLSLQQLAGRSGVSAAAIHKVERGDMVPTITTLLKLCAALDRPIGYFVDDAVRGEPVAVRLDAADRPGPPAEWAPANQGVAAESFAVPDERLPGGGVFAVVEPGGHGASPGSSDAGEELVLVQQGTLAVDVAGEQYLLRPGDSLHYPTNRPRSWRNPGDQPAHALWWYLHG